MWFPLSRLSVLRSFVLFFLCGVVIGNVRGGVGQCCHRPYTDIVGPIEVACTGRWGRGFHPVQIGVVVQQGRSPLSSASFQLCRELGIVVVVVAVVVVVVRYTHSSWLSINIMNVIDRVLVPSK